MSTERNLRLWGRRVLGAVGMFLASGAVVLARPPADAAETGNSEFAPEVLAAGADESWFQTVTGAIAREQYAARETEGGFAASNRAQSLSATFAEGRIELTPRMEKDVAPPWRFTWRTTGFGRPDRIEEVSSSSPSAAGARIVYERDGWSEWYENTAKGVEQGFTVAWRPEGEGPLQIVGTFPAALRPVLREDGAIDFLDEHQACAIRYGELHVWDATGREVAAELVLAEKTIAIQIEDEDAVYPLTVDPLMTSPAWTAESNQASASFGVSVATAGDVNGDGFSDVIVGAQEFDNPTIGEGRAFVYHGSASGLSVVPAWTAEGNQLSAHLGFAVATAGDVNGDGFDDVIVGAFSYSNGETDEGKAWVFHGSASGLQAGASWSAEGNQASAAFGISVGTAGDVNGDGFDDVVVGAYLFDNVQTDEGRAFVYYGSAVGVSPTANWTAGIAQTTARFGTAVGTAGDVNGDGYDEVIVGANLFDNGQTDEGRAYLYRGSAIGLSPSASWIAESDQAGAQLGTAVATAGDVNGDGYADVLIGAHGFDLPEANEGVVFVCHGSASGLNPTANTVLHGNQVGAFFGYAVSTAGDVNGDGFSDVLVGAYLFDDGHADEGEAFAYFGSATGLGLDPDWAVEGDQVSAELAVAVATAGDVNGDGFSDVIVGAYRFDNGQTDEGRAFVYHGSGGGLAPIHAWSPEGNQDSANFGHSVATAGDVNGDGYSDVIVGARGYSNGEFSEGRAYVFHGSAGTPSTTPAWIAEGNQVGAFFGASVAGAGDVNGDGFSDVIVGSESFDINLFDEGRAFVYHGSSTGLSASPAWTVEGDQAGAWFGASVASAGDVNGDGFLDVVIGAPKYSNGQDREGRAFVYHGSAAGLATTPAWSSEGNQALAELGTAAATAGDVNGDGYSDVVVGAPYYDNGQINEGRALVYHGSAVGLATTPSWTAASNLSTSDFGYSVAGAGDVNGDGYSDVIIGAPGYSTAKPSEGCAFVYHGSVAGLTATPDWIREGDQADSNFGTAVATAGDVNGDGFSDVIVGMPRLVGGGAHVYHGSATGLAAFPAWIRVVNQVGALFGSAVSSAGDMNGDGFSEVVVGSDRFDSGNLNEGAAFLFYGNEGRGLHRIPRQVRTDESGPIDLLGTSDSESAFRLMVLGRTAAGRGDVRLQFEVKPASVPFDGTGLVTGSPLNTGQPGAGGSTVPLSELASGLAPETLYHWRLRVLGDSPFFPRTPWMSLPYNGATEADVRTDATTTAVAESAEIPTAGLWLAPGTPNPFNPRTTLSFLVPARIPVRLAIHDVHGRLVRVLVEDVMPAGQHAVEWDGRDGQGQELATGVYLSRLEAGGEVRSQKLALVK